MTSFFLNKKASYVIICWQKGGNFMFEKLFRRKKEKKVFVEEEPAVTVTKEGDIYEAVLSDNVPIMKYEELKDECENGSALNNLHNGLLWDSGADVCKKGTYHIIDLGDIVYNFTNHSNKVVVDERIVRDGITYETYLELTLSNSHYTISMLEHTADGNTISTRYYDSVKMYGIEGLELSAKEAFDATNATLENLNNIDGVTNYLDLELFRSRILEDLRVRLEAQLTQKKD